MMYYCAPTSTALAVNTNILVLAIQRCLRPDIVCGVSRISVNDFFSVVSSRELHEHGATGVPAVMGPIFHALYAFFE